MPTNRFREVFSALTKANQEFASGELSSLDHSRAREACLSAALDEIAEDCGIKLQGPLQINSRGEFSLVALDPSGRDPLLGAGQYGEAFANILSRYSWRCGTEAVPAGTKILPENGWCRLNHFEAEKMVTDYAREHEIEESHEVQRGAGR